MLLPLSSVQVKLEQWLVIDPLVRESPLLELLPDSHWQGDLSVRAAGILAHY